MKKHYLKVVASVLLLVVLIVPNFILDKASADTNPPNDHNNKTNLDHQSTPPTFSNVSVHDPSIMRAKDGTYYVFGSHIAAAYSSDLMNWTSFTNGYTTPGNTLFGDLSKNLAGSFAWAGENDSDSKGGYAVWAPDVFWNKDYVNKDGSKGAYVMYYCTSSTYKRSAIGMAVSQDPKGPYTYVNTIIYSGFTSVHQKDANSNIDTYYTNTNIKKLIDNGTLTAPSDSWFTSDGNYNTDYAPNAIDPTAFYDKNGKLWLVYGSWSGGIFVLPVDKKTGEPLYPGKDGTAADGNHIDRYFGTKISGGFFKSGEGPFIVYDKDTDYYYLYESIGGLAANGGYNMRVYRSKNVDGPYLDPEGQNAVFTNSQADNADYGEKLMGNFLWDRKPGDPGSGIGVGYVSPGGNSVYYDNKTGKKFVVMHTRFPEQGEYHEVRVQQIFMNKNGWPVISPYRYAGETIQKVNRQDIVGLYKFINHGKATTANITKSVFIHLNKNNTITGDVTGTWKKTGDDQAEITIDGQTYDGVFVRDWDPTSQAYVMTFTAVSSQGITIWGSKQQNKPANQVVDAVYNDLTLGDTSDVTANLTLPTEGTLDSKITWTSSEPNIVSSTGEVTRPEDGSSPAEVTLTAAITKDGLTKTKNFTITVPPYQPANLVAHYALDGNLNDSTNTFAAGTVTGNKLDNTGGQITFTQGKNGQAAVFDGHSGIKLPNGLISNNSYSVSLWVKPTAMTQYTTTFFGARDTNNWISFVPNLGGHSELWSGSNWYDASVGTQIPIGQWTHIAFTVDKGTVNVYMNGEKQFTGTNFPDIFTGANASFGLGVNYWDPAFQGEMDDLQIFSGTLTPTQLANLSK